MKIRFAASKGDPQFIVTATTSEDMAMMNFFTGYPYGKDVIFWMHGSGLKSGPSGVTQTSFNFGWIDRKSVVQRHQRTWYHRLWRFFCAKLPW